MAQTKRKRRTKHRGNAAGQVEVRGRTGRPPTAAERRSASGVGGKGASRNRFDEPPTWSGAATRAGITSVLLLVLVLVLIKESIAVAIAMAVFSFAVYLPFGYYTDLFIYNRRQKKKLAAGAGKGKS